MIEAFPLLLSGSGWKIRENHRRQAWESHSYLIERPDGYLIGPFHDVEAALDYINAQNTLEAAGELKI